MDDIGKAIIMAGQVLMFTFAATISIYLYSSLTGRVNNVMLANNYSNRGDAIVDLEHTDSTRTAKKEEVFMAILDLKNKYEKTYDDSYAVMVGGDTYKYNSTENNITINDIVPTISNLEMKLRNIEDCDYRLTYDGSGKILIYTKK